MLISGSEDKMILFWDPSNNYSLTRKISARQSVFCLLPLDENLLLSCGDNQRMMNLFSRYRNDAIDSITTFNHYKCSMAKVRSDLVAAGGRDQCTSLIRV